MFETTLLPERKGRDARLVRVIAFGSLAAQALTVAAFIVVPLIYPATLPAMTVTRKLTSLDFKKPPVKVIMTKPLPVQNTNQAAIHAPSQAATTPTQAPRLGAASHASPANTSDIPVMLAVGGGSDRMGTPSSLGNGGSPFGTATGSGNVVVAKPAAPAGPINVSTGVSQGLLLTPLKPAYPRIAVAAHVEGTVVVTAIIDRSGRIINVQVVSGPAMLRAAATDAVRDARYKPYMLNGQPTEVISTFSITFRMNGEAG